MLKRMLWSVPCFSSTIHNQGCQIFLGRTYQNGENMPNDHKMY
jgi:hypothetical protein